jgi:hypothetical protein
MKYGGRPFEEEFATPMGATSVHGLPSRYKWRVDIAIQPKHELINFDLSKINKFVFLLLWWLWQTLVE